MFDNLYSEKIILKNPTGESDEAGEFVCEELPCVGFITAQSRRFSPENGGNTVCKWIFLIRSDVAPIPGCRLVWQDTEYLIDRVDTCKKSDNSIECFRCYCIA